MHAHQKYVGFVCSLFLIGHMYFEWYMARFLVNYRNQTYMACDEIYLLKVETPF